MKLQEACEKLNKLVGIRFKELFSPEEMEDIIIAKGKTGQLLELALGMQLSSSDLDFEDGELKTNKCDADGNPRETVFITQISAMIDELLAQKKFEDTKLFAILRNTGLAEEDRARAVQFDPDRNHDHDRCQKRQEHEGGNHIKRTFQDQFPFVSF